MASDEIAPPPPLGAFQRQVTDQAQEDELPNNNTISDKKVSFVIAEVKPSTQISHRLAALESKLYDFSDDEAFSEDDDSDVDTDDEYHNNKKKHSNGDESSPIDKTTSVPTETRPHSMSVRHPRTSSVNITQAERKRRQSARISHLLNAQQLTIYGLENLDTSQEDSDYDDFDRDPSPMSLQDEKTDDTAYLPEVIPDLRVKHKSMMEARDYIEREVISTEETYVNGLRVLIEEFFGKIFEEKLIKEKYRIELQSNLPILYKFHCQFLQLLRKGPIPHVFNSQADFFKMYTQYVNDYDSILNKFGEFRGNKKLQAFLRAKRKQKKPLTNHLILPIQRVPRYTLLLTDLKKHTPKEHNDYEELCQALEKIDKISHVINERKREIENMSQCLQVQENLKELKDSIVAPHRRFLKQYYFFKKKKARQFFVFNDILIISDDKWRVKETIEMRLIAIRRDTTEQTVFTVYSSSKPQAYNTEVLQDINEFIKVIEKYRAKVWEGDVSRLSKHGGGVLKQLLQEQGVSQSEQYRQQVHDLKKQQNDEIMADVSFGLLDAAEQFKFSADKPKTGKQQKKTKK